MVAALSVPLGTAHAQALRPLTPLDLLAIERIDEVVPSPAGHAAAIVVIRARTAANAPPRFLMSGYDRADVWLTRGADGPAAPLTDGVRDGSGFYFPTWSPDGERLALLSTRGGAVTPWIWTRSSGELRQLLPRSVEHARPVWISPTRLALAAPPAGSAPQQWTLDTESASHLMATWPAAFAAQRATASVVRSPGAESEDPRLRGELLDVDVPTAATRVWATGAFTALTLSPDRRWLAAARATHILRPASPAPLPNVNPVRYGLALLSAETSSAEPAVVDDIAVGSIRWQRGGDALVAAAHRSPTVAAHPVTLTRRGDRFVVDASGVVGTDGAGGAPPGAGSVPPTPAGADLAAFDPTSRTAYFRETSRRGSRLLAASAGDAAPRVVLERNTFLASVAEGTLRRITYRTADGQQAIAWLLLPPGARQGTRHPTVVWVYGGLVYGDDPPPYFVPLNSPGTFNLQVLAARGYAVLLPSIPLGAEGGPGDPLSAMPKAVLPAVDAAIATGQVDERRLAVMGHSFGGYAVYALITQTTRFRAAVAMAGASNLVSLYGQFDPRARHLETARDRLLAMVFAESGQYRMGGPLADDVDRYVRNSPIAHARGVTTPTLIVQGDLDYVPIQQGEEFFTALYRRGVASEFVRYWGEGHTIESPPNILDLWTRVFAWLDTHLLPH